MPPTTECFDIRGPPVEGLNEESILTNWRLLGTVFCPSTRTHMASQPLCPANQATPQLQGAAVLRHIKARV